MKQVKIKKRNNVQSIKILKEKIYNKNTKKKSMTKRKKTWE